MSIDVYKSGRANERLRNGPLGAEPFLFAAEQIEQGYTPEYIRCRFGIVTGLSQWMIQQGLKLRALEPRSVDRFMESWSRHTVRDDQQLVMRKFVDFLRRRGKIPPERIRVTKLSAIDRFLADYLLYLRDQRGLCEYTFSPYLQYARNFLLNQFGTLPLRFERLEPQAINRYILKQSADRPIDDVRRMTTSLRTLFRYLMMRGWIEKDLSACVTSPVHWRPSRLPLGLTSVEVKKVLGSCDRGEVTGKRDYAILLLLARLGLRAQEVLHLTLEDLDWRKGEIRILESKTHRRSVLPMSEEIGRAIIDYLKHSRPKRCRDRKLFVCLIGPPRGFRCSSSIDSIVRFALRRAGLNPPRQGAHLFRHTLANLSLRRGATLSEIAQILRHSHVDTTGGYYAKVDFNRLIKVASPWPKVPLPEGIVHGEKH